ncbi:hypothetical protein CY34DRAFT_17775 [Suillus luteus UH-Slu-Lm8-n1]|uniref:Unplaced genomic scaffold CY34scaffold_634, whole genome shotgun sequence n=1 Tax=Suillus luteus UH-Slu-Lm8-n1 TaxID=930992 RepID=A0A0D0AJD1_9AGAM|nr:hypothetical protein CY34DRAFT_17775 [Suillus luteus UH-Slu-Lm8-n1]
MTSTLRPTLAPFSPISHEYQGNSCNILPGSALNTQQTNFLAWHKNVSQEPEHGAYPSPPTTHEADLQEPSSMDTLCLPPFWETRHDSDLTIRLISTQQSERRAECRLIRRRLHRILIEQELYSRMDKHTAHRLHKADVSVGVARGVLRSSGLTPTCNMFEKADSDVSSVSHGSGAESDAESTS